MCWSPLCVTSALNSQNNPDVWGVWASVLTFPLVKCHGLGSEDWSKESLKTGRKQMPPQTSKQAAKEAIQYFSLLCTFCCKRSLFPFSSVPYIFLSIILLLMYLKKPFLLALISFTRFNFKWALTFIASCKGKNPAIVNAGLLGHAQNYFSGNTGERNLFSLAPLMKKNVHIDRKKYFSLGK